MPFSEWSWARRLPLPKAGPIPVSGNPMLTFSHPRPSPAIARAVWAWGAGIVVALWAAVALALLARAELPTVGQAKLAGLFALLLAGWTVPVR